ncbi:MAG: DUF3422 family protein [Woeseiaceae bacterium]
MPIQFKEHPDRASLQAEAHARPPVDINTIDSEVWHWVLRRSDPDDSLPDAIDSDTQHQVFEFDRSKIRFELHTEFFTVTYFGAEAPDGAALDFIQSFPGELLTSLRLIFRLERDKPLEAALFGSRRIFGGAVCENRIGLKTDFHVGDSSAIPFVVTGRFDDPYLSGRIAKRIIDVETYRMASLLGFTLARELSSELAELERHADAISQTALRLKDAELNNLITRLSAIMSEATNLHSRVRYRFGASNAYNAIVESRLELLNEAVVDDRQTLRGFIEHRLSPAIKTINSFEKRLQELSSQLTSLMDLIRTWVDRNTQLQNQQLLQSMERRARQQVHIGQAVEGLSVAAITYYGVGLLSALVKSLPDLALAKDTITALSIPLIGFLAWRLIHRTRRQLDKM